MGGAMEWDGDGGWGDLGRGGARAGTAGPGGFAGEREGAAAGGGRREGGRREGEWGHLRRGGQGGAAGGEAFQRAEEQPHGAVELAAEQQELDGLDRVEEHVPGDGAAQAGDHGAQAGPEIGGEAWLGRGARWCHGGMSMADLNPIQGFFSLIGC